MHHISRAQVEPLISLKTGVSEFNSQQLGNKTFTVIVDAQAIEDLCVYPFQTNQLRALVGSLVLVILQNRRYNYIMLNAERPAVITIPAGVPYSFINLSDTPSCLMNDVLHCDLHHRWICRHVKPPFPYDIAWALQLLKETQDIQDHRPILKVL